MQIGFQWDLSIANVNLMSWALWMWILRELSFVNVNFKRAEYYQCKFMRAELSQCEFSESRAEHCKCELIWAELSFVNVNFMRAVHCQCKVYESWALGMWIY